MTGSVQWTIVSLRLPRLGSRVAHGSGLVERAWPESVHVLVRNREPRAVNPVQVAGSGRLLDNELFSPVSSAGAGRGPARRAAGRRR